MYSDLIAFCAIEWRVLNVQHFSLCLRLTQYNVALLLRRRGTCSCTSSRPNATAVNFCPMPRMARFISSKMAVAVNHSPPSMSDTSRPLPTGANSNNLAKHSRRGDAWYYKRLCCCICSSSVCVKYVISPLFTSCSNCA